MFKGLAGDTVCNMSPYENTIWNIKVKAAGGRNICENGEEK
jgi:hypothetical protein